MGTRHWPEDADDEVERLEGVIKHFRAEVARLKEELASLRQQQSEPVAGLLRTQSNTIECLYKGALTPIDGNHFHKEFVDALPLGKTVPLYAAPPAQSESERDAARLNWLDEQNKRKNKHYGTTYGWRYSENHNRIALEDHNFPSLSIRDAIDAAMEGNK